MKGVAHEHRPVSHGGLATPQNLQHRPIKKGNMMAAKKKTKRRARTRETGDDASSAASKLLKMKGQMWCLTRGKPTRITRLVRKVSASCLNQDQTKGQRGR
jgi:hypothetical protein